MTNATLITGGGEIWIGGSADNIQTEGEFNLAGGSVLVSNWTAIGRSFGASGNSKGVLNLINGAWTNRGANNFVVTSAANNNGKVNVFPAGTLVTGTGNQIWVGEGGNGIMNINGGTVLAGRTANPALVVGRAGGGAGSIRLTSGILDSADQTYLGHGTGTAGSYGELNQMGGTAISRWYFVVGFNNDRSIYRQTGGAFFITNRFMTVAAGGTASIGMADLSGGTFTALDAGGDGGIYVAERGFGTLNIRGNAVVSVTGTPTAGGLRFGGGTGAYGTMNLLGGVLMANRVAKTTAASIATVNFNGGVLRANMTNSAFMTGLNNAYVLPGGAIIDDGGFAIAIGQALLAPTANGVTTIAVASGGSNYIGAPLLLISGGTGTNATAIANMVDDGSGNGTYSVGSVTVTSPGSYTVDPTTVSFLMGGQNATVATAGAITTAANASGGLTKIGSGITTLGGANTYTGLTIVSNGTLNVNGSIAGAVTVKAGATLGGTGSIAGVVTVESGGALGAGTSIGTLTLGGSPSLASGSTVVAELSRTNAQTADLISVTGPLAFNGTLVLRNIGLPLQVGDSFTLFTASGGYSGSFTLVSQTLGQVVTWNTSNLGVNGTVSVASVAPVGLAFGRAGSTLSLAWPPNQLGMTLQTNAIGVAAPAWFPYPGSINLTNLNIPINPNASNVFFRLVYP
jgi:autotransporter-associated beta strand protein